MVVRLRDRVTGRLDLQAAFASANSKTGSAASMLSALPCPHRDYTYSTEVTGLGAEAPRESYSAIVSLGAAHLLAGISCDQPLPTWLGTSALTLTVRGDGGSAGYDVKFEFTGRRLTTGNLSGLAPQYIGNTLCDGRYILLATLRTPTRQLSIDYPFVLRDVQGAAECQKRS